MTTTTAPKPKYQVGQRVEVERTDFETPGFPMVWMPGTVDEVTWDEQQRLFSVRVAMDAGPVRQPPRRSPRWQQNPASGMTCTPPVPVEAREPT